MGSRTFRVRREGANDTPAHGKLRKKKPASQQQNTRLELGLVQDKKNANAIRSIRKKTKDPPKSVLTSALKFCAVWYSSQKKKNAIPGNSKFCFSNHSSPAQLGILAMTLWLYWRILFHTFFFFLSSSGLSGNDNILDRGGNERTNGRRITCVKGNSPRAQKEENQDQIELGRRLFLPQKRNM